VPWPTVKTGIGQTIGRPDSRVESHPRSTIFRLCSGRLQPRQARGTLPVLVTYLDEAVAREGSVVERSGAGSDEVDGEVVETGSGLASAAVSP
jgi:hypothetical protein